MSAVDLGVVSQLTLDKAIAAAGDDVPPGVLESLVVYLSDFGAKAIAAEQTAGPPPSIFKGAMEVGSRVRSGAEIEGSGSECDDESSHSEESIFDQEALREYELGRLKYFYAVATFDRPESADLFFDYANGMEIEATGNTFSLQRVPDSMDFDASRIRDAFGVDAVTLKPTPTQRATQLAAHRPLNWTTPVLAGTTVKLTWDSADDRILTPHGVSGGTAALRGALLGNAEAWTDADRLEAITGQDRSMQPSFESTFAAFLPGEESGSESSVELSEGGLSDAEGFDTRVREKFAAREAARDDLTSDSDEAEADRDARLARTRRLELRKRRYRKKYLALLGGLGGSTGGDESDEDEADSAGQRPRDFVVKFRSTLDDDDEAPVRKRVEEEEEEEEGDGVGEGETGAAPIASWRERQREAKREARRAKKEQAERAKQRRRGVTVDDEESESESERESESESESARESEADSEADSESEAESGSSEEEDPFANFSDGFDEMPTSFVEPTDEVLGVQGMEAPSKKGGKGKKGKGSVRPDRVYTEEERETLKLVTLNAAGEEEIDYDEEAAGEERRGKKGKGKGKGKRGRGGAEDEGEAKRARFAVDTSDPRFAPLYESPAFALDPTSASFRRNAATDAILEERRKRRRAIVSQGEAAVQREQARDDDGRAGGDSASSIAALADRVKAKSAAAVQRAESGVAAVDKKKKKKKKERKE
jgi:hypothetical protein